MRAVALLFPLAVLLGACGESATMPTGLTAATSAEASAAQGAKKYGLAGPSAIIYCNDVTPYPGDNAGTPIDGFVVFNATKGRLMATVSVKNVAPNTDYVVRLIQGNAGDCHVVDGTLKTNGQGNGTAHFDEAVAGTAAQVIIDTSFLFGPPTYRATDIFNY